MDFHLKQWRNQQYESEQEEQEQEQHSAKIPKLLLDHHQQQPHQIKPEPSPVSSALPLFVPDHHHQPNNKIIPTHLSVAFPDQSTTTTPVSSSRHHPRMGSYFSLAQWQELELQALIFRYMLAGAAVPPELLQPIKKSFNLLHNPPYFLHHPTLQPYAHHFQPAAALFQTGYWGRAAMDPEPGRCRRTDGKKWRCSRDVVVGQKYCERHMHRGRNRSRKPVETPTSVAGRVSGVGAASGGGGGGTLSSSSATAAGGSPLGTASGGTHFALSGPSSSIDLLHLNRSSSDVSNKRESKDLFEPHNEVSGSDGKSGGHILRHFFDDWSRSLQEASSMNSSTTSLSISMPGNSSSDVSLKLSTGDGDGPAQQDGHMGRDHHPQLGWATVWGASPMTPMGGPLAEALRSSNSNSSPTSVLHQLPRGSASESCIVSS
ncbi:hypothetical protein L484_013790 [Morus notabilis]|uniref:Growth-regulating factor n=1 Tax=Morus notabilis TaxID=981085 RepID=W9R437_9ROSA|nr:growth-regulating factor 3 [Morus notabilis]EXB37752.1 hypothetical protein L484_013790 [Morus notabilis]